MQDRKEERDDFKSTLKACDYPNWSFKEKDKQNKNTDNDIPKKEIESVLHYTQGASEKRTRIYRIHEIILVFRSDTKIRNL